MPVRAKAADLRYVKELNLGAFDVALHAFVYPPNYVVVRTLLWIPGCLERLATAASRQNII